MTQHFLLPCGARLAARTLTSAKALVTPSSKPPVAIELGLFLAHLLAFAAKNDAKTAHVHSKVGQT